MKKKIIIYGGAILAAAGAVAGGLLIWKNRKDGPKGVVPVKPFDVERYMGDWYEVARMPNHFEKDLINTTAHYLLNDDGSIKVINRGHNNKTNAMQETTGKAKFAASSDTGKLKVSFFYPFYSAYNIIALDPDYKYSLVAGKDLSYLWLLSREKEMPEEVKKDYLQKAQQIGYDISHLIWVEHSV